MATWEDVIDILDRGIAAIEADNKRLEEEMRAREEARQKQAIKELKEWFKDIR